MSLHFVVDGYNLLYALPEMPPGAWEAKRETLLARLGRQAPQGRNKLTVVFDSREGLGDRGRVGEIEFVFTAGESADDWISAYIRRAPNARVIVVVTDDKGIHQLIHGTGAKVMATSEFLKRGVAATTPAPLTPPVDQDAITDELRKKWLE